MTNPADSSSEKPKDPVISVAIIEDDPEIREILRGWVNEEPGLRCLEVFSSAEAALDTMPALAPMVCLVDINLPGVNGIECVRRLKFALGQTQFVMLTVYEDAQHLFDALVAGASGYLLKRTARRVLLDAVKEVHSGGSPMTSNIARLVVESFQAISAKANVSENLSPRETEVLELIARGYLYKEVADSIGVSVATVKTYIRRICEKLHVRSRAEAVARYANLPLRPRG